MFITILDMSISILELSINILDLTITNLDLSITISQSRSILECEDLPSNYSPEHLCLGTEIKVKNINRKIENKKSCI